MAHLAASAQSGGVKVLLALLYSLKNEGRRYVWNTQPAAVDPSVKSRT